MDKKKKLLIMLLVFVLLLGGASVLYKQLGKNADANQLSSETDVASEEQDDKDEAEDERVMAPDMTVYDWDGKEVHLSDYIGKPIVLNFWASWCGPCQMEMPDFNEKYQELGEEVQFLMINMTDGSRETVEKASAFIEEQGYGFPVFYDTKFHAAAYAVVSYQTAWSKYCYPVEFMAALMTSMIDNPGKVSEYIYSCRQMGIKILPPDINDGIGEFSVDGGNIRFGLAAIKSIGRPVIEAIIAEREARGRFKTLKDFIERLSGKEVNKRTIESFIKSGAFDSLSGTRKQLMIIYVQILDQVNQERKYSMAGQMSLFDMVGEDQKSEFDIQLPDVGEYEKETRLAFEKEVLGVYLTGHPMEEYEAQWRKQISKTTLDFQFDEEVGTSKVRDGAREIIGGIIAGKTIKYTKNNKVMAFLTVEDLLGTVEVVVFPKDYEKYKEYLEEENKIFVRGRVSEEDDANSKLICESIVPFHRMRKELWLQYESKEIFLAQEKMLYEMLADSDGEDEVVIYCKKERAVKRLGQNRNVRIQPTLLSRLTNFLGESCIKVIEKPIENI